MDETKPKRKILLIEDEFVISELYRTILESADFDVDCALNGTDGMKKAQEKPDLILLDIMLPGMNGLDLLKTFKAQPQTKIIPVIILTNLGQDEILKESFELGASGFLIKMNLSPDQLIRQVQKVLENPNIKVENQATRFIQ